jgi:hypothetical protein
VSEQLNALISKYAEKADAGILKAEEHIVRRESELVEWQERRAAALATADSLGQAEVFNSIYLEAGGLNSNNFRTLAPSLMGMDDEFKSQLALLFKRKDAPKKLESAKNSLQNAIAIKDKGAEAYLLEVRQAIGQSIATLPNPSKGWNSIIKSQEGFADLQNTILDDKVDGPRGVFSSPELFAMVVEAGNPLDGSEEEGEDPLNEEETPAPEPTANTLNPDEIPEETPETDGPLNDGNGEIVETEPENEVETKTPELEAEVLPTPDVQTREEIDAERGFVEVAEVSSINPEAEIEDFNTDADPTVTLPEYDETAPSVINDIVENVKNEVNNVSSQINEAIEGDDRSGLNVEETETDVASKSDGITPEEVLAAEPSDGITADEVLSESPILEGETVETNINNKNVENHGDIFNENSKSEINEESETTTNTLNPKVEAGPSSINDDDDDISFADIAAMKERFGMTDSPEGDTVEGDTEISSESSTINDSVSVDEVLNDNSITEGATTEINSINSSIENAKESATEAVSGGIEVAKSKIGLDKKIAPINTPKADEPKDTSSDSVTATEVLNEKSSSESTDNTKSETTDNSTSSETTTNNNSASAPTMVDMSGVEARLRKIENLLSGPLEVKIID